MRSSEEAFEMIVSAKRRFIEELENIEDEKLKTEYRGKIKGLNVAIDILADKY